MKSHKPRSLRRLLLKITYYSQYTDQVYKLEQAVARKPAKLQIEMIGSGEIPPDAALLMRTILLQRSPQTRVITNARSSLQNGSVLVWLLGDTRQIREDAKLYFRKPNKEDEDDDGEDWKGEESDESETDLEEVEYAQVLQHIDNFLPVKELAGRPVNREVLRQFGLVDNEEVDHFLASAFAQAPVSPESDKPGPHPDQQKPATPKVPASIQPNRHE